MNAVIVDLAEYRLQRRIHREAQGRAPRRRFLWVDGGTAQVRVFGQAGHRDETARPGRAIPRLR